MWDCIDFKIVTISRDLAELHVAREKQRVEEAIKDLQG
jgi:hypothetical protein